MASAYKSEARPERGAVFDEGESDTYAIIRFAQFQAPSGRTRTVSTSVPARKKQTERKAIAVE